MKNILFILMLMLFLASSSFGQNHPMVKISVTKAGMAKLAATGIPVDDGFFDGNHLTTVIPGEFLSGIKQAGFQTEIIHEDYPSFISARNKADETVREDINRMIHLKAASMEYPVPAGFELGSMGGYYTPDEVMEELDSMYLQYPGLVSQRSEISPIITWDGNKLYYVSITNKANTQAKPKILYDALTHAREPMGMQQLIFYMWYLLENYGTDPEVTYLLDNIDIYFIPVMNPDGYAYNYMTYPSGGGDWRKNRRDNGSGFYGVDLNRNFGYMWGYDDIGSSPYPGELTYRGPSAFSEPETQAVRDFTNEKQIRIALNYHTYGSLFLYPWSYIEQDTPDSLTNVNFSRIMTRDNRYTCGTPGSVLYTTNGDINDWLYGEQTTKPKTLSYTAETGNDGDGFWPIVSRILPLCQENMYQNLMLANLSFKYAEAVDASPVIIPERMGYLAFSLTRYGMESGGTYTVSIRPLDNTQIISVGNPKVFNNPAQFTTFKDSIFFALDGNFPVGGQFRYIIDCNNGHYTFTDTVTKWFGTPVTVFTDNCNSMANWWGSPWNITTNAFHSPTGSITDSPSGNYSNNANSSVTTTNNIDLRDSPVAELTYWTKFNTEAGFDYVQVKISDSAGNVFTPYAGRYTRKGSPSEDQGNPVYDGIQNEWVHEQIAISNMVNNDIRLRFSLKSDLSTRRDGFYFDDVMVRIIDMTTSGIKERNSTGYLSDPLPNPAGSRTMINYDLNGSGISTFILTTTGGVILEKRELKDRKGSISIMTRDYPAGVYLYYITGTSGTSEVRKLIVIH